MYSNKTNQVTNEILNQLGGNKFISMTDAIFSSYGDMLIVNFKGSKIANRMFIKLLPNDTYEIKICKFKGLNIKMIKEITDVCCDMLRPIFEQTTGLRTSL